MIIHRVYENFRRVNGLGCYPGTIGLFGSGAFKPEHKVDLLIGTFGQLSIIVFQNV